jgi:putative transcriptional regulator
MDKTIVFAGIRPDGTLVRVNPGGGEEALPGGPVVSIAPEEAVRRGPGTPAPSAESSKRTRLAPHVATLRGALALTQEEFATRYQIPLDRLRDWEQERSKPDEPMRAYLVVIARHPEVVRRALRRHARAVRQMNTSSSAR